MSGAERIEAALRRAGTESRLGFIPYITAGDPDLQGTRRLASVLGRAGADVLELGVPWSDPLADGPVNQRAAERALASGTTLQRLIEALPAIREAASIPVVLFTYLNPVLRIGLERFAEAAARAGADGVLVTDLPPEEAVDYRAALGRCGLATIFLAAPTSTEARLEAVSRASTGFVYAVSRTGVTGAREAVQEEIRGLVGRLRGHTALPIAVGFGISSAAQVAALRGQADAFVVGSALVERIGRLGAGEEGVAAVSALARELTEAGTFPEPDEWGQE